LASPPAARKKNASTPQKLYYLELKCKVINVWYIKTEFVVKKYKIKTVIKSRKDKRKKRKYNQKVMMSWGEEKVSQMKLIRDGRSNARMLTGSRLVQ